jgi:hypothetical protein
MYFIEMSLLNELGIRHFCFDVIEGAIDRIIQANAVLRVLYAIGYHRVTFTSRQHSYSAINDSTGAQERFEKLRMTVPMLMRAFRVYRSWLELASKISGESSTLRTLRRMDAAVVHLSSSSQRSLSHSESIDSLSNSSRSLRRWSLVGLTLSLAAAAAAFYLKKRMR